MRQIKVQELTFVFLLLLFVIPLIQAIDGENSRESLTLMSSPAPSTVIIPSTRPSARSTSPDGNDLFACICSSDSTCTVNATLHQGEEIIICVSQGLEAVVNARPSKKLLGVSRLRFEQQIDSHNHTMTLVDNQTLPNDQTSIHCLEESCQIRTTVDADTFFFLSERDDDSLRGTAGRLTIFGSITVFDPATTTTTSGEIERKQRGIRGALLRQLHDAPSRSAANFSVTVSLLHSNVTSDSSGSAAASKSSGSSSSAPTIRPVSPGLWAFTFGLIILIGGCTVLVRYINEKDAKI